MVIKIKKYLTLLLLFFTTITNGQNEIRAIAPCIDSLTNNQNYIKTNYKKIELVKTQDKQLKIKYNGKTKSFDDQAILSWLEKVNIDSIKAFKLYNCKNYAYLLSSFNEQATGLAINFFSHIIIYPNENCIVEFESLAKNEKLVYLNQSSNNIEFIAFTYGDSFFWKRDYDDIDFEIETNEIIQGKVKIIKNENVFCPK